MNELRNRIHSFPGWGYVIYRTTYSAESDTLFPDAIRYIEACIKRDFFSENENDPTDEANEIWAKHRSTIMQDPEQFNGTSLEAIRAHFEAWVNAQGRRDNWTKFRMCMIIDDESLQTLKGTSVETLENERPEDLDNELRCVKVLEAFPIMDELDTFPGWMRCWTSALWDLWTMMGDGDEMRQLFDSIDGFPFEGVYCG
ncbi:uncharacterized protein N7515_001934 [Penicillium bovifimosum]|uniref:Uncharacterized protein n=1 Tax=Penicillium bovifimosum TaxID=126998 RepID=A0A9W9L988_9EURO|nr:uncharacterized protein N7515_001934 [Penicillium bovifimosum]KAJ5143147.1 hypothetical protein N7515_001934 [Penicillium bovifimosum]